jgi:hypothetical protein
MKVLMIALNHFHCKIYYEQFFFKIFIGLLRYKGKGSNRSDEIGDDKRIYAKFKVNNIFQYLFIR